MNKKTIIIICGCIGLIVLLLGVIFIMSLGITMYNTASNVNEETIEEIRNNTTELHGIEAIDSQVRDYEDRKLEYLVVHVMISKIKLCNEKFETEKIKVEYKSKSGLADVNATSENTELIGIQGLLNKEHKYKISISEINTNGLISTMLITEV